MAYTTYTEVQADFKDITFTPTSNITDTDVTQFIAEADAVIDAHISGRYAVPVASGAGLVLLKTLSRSLVTARVKRILEVKNEKAADANQSVVGVLLSPTTVLKILGDIRDGKVNIDGAAAVGTEQPAFYSANVANDVQAVFDKDTKQW